MNLSKYNLTKEQKKYFISKSSGYQPFTIDENKQSIARGYWPPPTPEYQWFYDQKKKANKNMVSHWNGGGHMILDKNQVTENEWDKYVKHNNMHNDMFDTFIEGALSLVDTPETVIDVGCNDGSLLLRALEKGCKKGIGYDAAKEHRKIFNLWRDITNFDITFIPEKYNSETHCIPKCKSGDFVIANAILCHLSDPLHFIKFLSNITNKVLLISCGVENTDNFTINYHGKPKQYGYGEFPNVFTHHTTISKSLFIYSLQECGFTEIYEIEHESTFPPEYWYYGQGMMGFIAKK